MRPLGTVLGWLGWALLGAAAAAGVAVAGVALFAISPVGGPVVASTVIRLVDDAVKGSLSLEAARVLPGGGIEVRGLSVRDPEGDEVLRVGVARLYLDLRHLRARDVGVGVELQDPIVDLGVEDDGSLSLANAFAPERPSPEEEEGPSRWTVRITRLELRGGVVRAAGREAVPDLAVEDLSLSARGVWGPSRGAADLRLRGTLTAPRREPIALDLRGRLDGDAVRIGTLRAEVGPNALEAVGEGDLARRTGRMAVLRIGVARADLAQVVPGAKALGGNLAGGAYAESDGKLATAALHLAPGPGDGKGAGGHADATAAARLEGPLAFGFRVVTEGLDPSRLVGAAPEGTVSLTATGAARGSTLAALRGHLDLSIAPSRIGKATFGPVALAARADRGSFDVSRLDARIPGLTLQGEGRYQQGGAISGSFTAAGTDLSRALATVEAATGVALPDLSGRAHVEAHLAGTSARPALDAAVDAPDLRLGDLAVSGARLRAALSGPRAKPDAQVEGTLAAFRSAGAIVMRAVRLRGALVAGEGSVELTAAFPGVGTGPLDVTARGALGPRQDRLRLSELGIAWPGARWQLVRPVELAFAGPTVDRLELEAGPQRLAVEGGLGPRGRVDARAEAHAVDLTRLPPGVLPTSLGLAGRVTFDAAVTGTLKQPVAVAHLALEDGALYGENGLAALASARWDGAARRAVVDAEVRRARGGAFAIRADLPGALARARPGEAIAAVLHAEGIDLAEVARLARLDLPIAGTVGLDATVGGTVGVPTLEARAALDGGAYADLAPLVARVSVEAPGQRARLEVRADHGVAGGVRLDAEVPLDLAEVIARPAAAVAALRRAPLQAHAEVPGLELAALAGTTLVPAGVAGRLVARADLAGTLAAPRGTISLQLQDGAFEGYTGLGATIQAALRNDGVTAEALGAVGNAAAIQLAARLGAPPEKLVGAEALRRAPVRIEATVPQLALARATTGEVPLAGMVDARLTVTGTLAAPVADLTATGSSVAVSGRPLGELAVRAHYADGRGTAEADLVPGGGGRLHAALAVTAPIGLGAGGAKLAEAPAEATVRAERVGLGILAALAPGTIRTAQGILEADLRAKGPIARLRPRGELHVVDGRVAVSEYGEWTGIGLDATLADDEVRVTRLVARRHEGRLEATAAARGLLGETAALEAHARLDKLTVVNAGQDAATVDLKADATGTLRGNLLDAKVTLDSATVQLPRRSPRTLQAIDTRSDIVVGKPKEKKARPEGPVAEEDRPFHANVQVLIPARLQVLSDSPRIDLTLRGDTRFEYEQGELFADGTIDVVRGEVEPIGGRVFEVQRGRVQFTGGPPRAAVVDVQALYDNPTAKITVLVTGPALHPTIKLSSEPAMDEAQIAIFIATGQTTLKPGTGSVGTLTGEEAGKAVLGVYATKVFKDAIADRLPLDTIAIDQGGVRAGTYINDRVYVGYSRRFDATSTTQSSSSAQRQNTDEFRIEYQITPRWTLEGQVGNERSTGSLIWSRDY